MSKAPLSASRGRSLQETGPQVPQSFVSADETARYIAEFTAELSCLARQSKLDLLAYLLDMARIEASRTLKGGAKRA